MKKYKFLFKPLFFIFSLLFSSWMVLAIEKISPSDFGRYESLFKTPADSTVMSSSLPKPGNQLATDKQHLKKLCLDFKAGLIDSVKLDQQLEIFIGSQKK